MRFALALLALTLLVGPAHAAGSGDFKAKRLFDRAVESWDADPPKALNVLERALEVPDLSAGLSALLLLSKGRLLVAKLGDPQAAEPVFDEILSTVPTKRHKARWELLGRALAKAEGDPAYEEQLPRLQAEYQDLGLQLDCKAQAMVAKANLCYAERGEVERALKIYLGADYTMQSATTCDVASQFCYRVSRERDRDAELRARMIARAEEFALEALRLAPAQVDDAEQRKGLIARYLLQLAIVYWAQGNRTTSRLVEDMIDPQHLGPETLYQQSVFAALRGEDTRARELMRAFFDTTRSTAAARNDLRKFVRGEPDLQRLIGDASWRYLVEDE